MIFKRLKPGTKVWFISRIESYGWIVEPGTYKEQDLIDFIHIEWKDPESDFKRDYSFHCDQNLAFESEDDARIEALKRNKKIQADMQATLKCLAKTIRKQTVK